LAHLRLVVQRGLDKTGQLWPEVREAYRWVQQAAHILANAEQQDEARVRDQYEQLLATLTSQQARDDWLGSVARNFLKVSANYGDGSFHCSAVPDLPATTNDLERRFGKLRYHERRSSGRRAVSGGLVLRGAVRVVAVLSADRLEVATEQLRLRDREAWHKLRQQLKLRAERRRAQRRFRQDPVAYLAKLEQQLLQ
jgi:hypothetical protein